MAKAYDLSLTSDDKLPPDKQPAAETLEEIANRIAGFSLVAYHDNPDAVRAQIRADVLAALRHVSNRTCYECATVIPDGSGYCRTCDNFTMPSDFYVRWVRRTEMEEALRNERERCAKVADRWANAHSCAIHDNDPCCHVRTGARIAEVIREGK